MEIAGCGRLGVVDGVERIVEDGEKVWRGDDPRRDDEHEISSIDFLCSIVYQTSDQDHSFIQEALGEVIPLSKYQNDRQWLLSQSSTTLLLSTSLSLLSFASIVLSDSLSVLSTSSRISLSLLYLFTSIFPVATTLLEQRWNPITNSNQI